MSPAPDGPLGEAGARLRALVEITLSALADIANSADMADLGLARKKARRIYHEAQQTLNELDALLAAPVVSPSWLRDDISDVIAHWFCQGGEAQFGALRINGREPQNADELVAAILHNVRQSAPVVTQEGEEPCP